MKLPPKGIADADCLTEESPACPSQERELERQRQEELLALERQAVLTEIERNKQEELRQMQVRSSSSKVGKRTKRSAMLWSELRRTFDLWFFVVMLV